MYAHWLKPQCINLHSTYGPVFSNHILKHAGKYCRNRIKSNRKSDCIYPFPIDLEQQTENGKSENGKYNLNFGLI